MNDRLVHRVETAPFSSEGFGATDSITVLGLRLGVGVDEACWSVTFREPAKGVFAFPPPPLISRDDYNRVGLGTTKTECCRDAVLVHL